ncbi:MAG TPA: SRPBCC domain-containing protein [Aliidongia sp.]|uniref:SRPBCC family protein n=1 Tax=Aliidongia sp. TaxID=1914230 RepID=UPI002DDD2F9B|nr:SRPBCC domain-containing protein [Aliidongia sp.]HEV2676937.1 SRPBCC domain-containing protein [Aliidongia sp.]
MDMTGEYRIAAPRAKVWAALNDAEILRQAIPGCDEIEKTSDTSFTAKVTAKVGPVKASFGGKVTLSDMDPPNGYTITGEGSGGVAGFAKGGAKVGLVDDGAGTLLTYAVDAQVGGKLAQIGSRLIDGTARKMAEEFFTRFAALVAEGELSPPVPIAATPDALVAAEPTPEPVPESAATIAAEPAIEAAYSSAVDPHAAPMAMTAAPEPEPAAIPAAATVPPASATLGTAGGATPVSTGNKPSGGLNPWIWIPALVIVLGIVVAIFR